MLDKEIEKELRAIKLDPDEYFKAKEIVKEYEKKLVDNEEILKTKFYVQQDYEYYSVGTFGGWQNGLFMLKIEDVEPFSHIKNTHFVITEMECVYSRKTKNMKHLNVGVE